MKKILIVVLGILLGAAPIAMSAAQETAAAPQGDRAYFVCNCKDDCACNTIAKKAGKCTCGSELVAVHLVRFEKTNAVFCRCGGECTCEQTKADPGKCGCGKPVKMVSVKGKYICSCGTDCKCTTISDKPGKCGCGKDLKLVA